MRGRRFARESGDNLRAGDVAVGAVVGVVGVLSAVGGEVTERLKAGEGPVVGVEARLRLRWKGVGVVSNGVNGRSKPKQLRGF